MGGAGLHHRGKKAMVFETSDRKPKNKLDIKIGTEPRRIRPLTFREKVRRPSPLRAFVVRSPKPPAHLLSFRNCAFRIRSVASAGGHVKRAGIKPFSKSSRHKMSMSYSLQFPTAVIGLVKDYSGRTSAWEKRRRHVSPPKTNALVTPIFPFCITYLFSS